MSHVFISYAHEDGRRRDQIRNLLETNGIKVWVDERNMRPGDSLPEKIYQAIKESRCLLVIYTKRVAGSNWVWREIEHAVDCGVPVLVISFGDVSFPSDDKAWLADISRIAVKRVFSQNKQNDLVQFVSRYFFQQVCPVVTMLNIKGGVGKTILTANLLGCLHEYSRKSVLLIDFDPQHNLTQLLLDEGRMAQSMMIGANVMSMFRGFGETSSNTPPTDTQIRTVAQKCITPLKVGRLANGPKIDLIPGSFELITYFIGSRHQHYDPASEMARNLKRLIDHYRSNYDLIAIDINPGASLMTELALNVSTHIISPVRPDRFAKYGLTLLDTLLDELGIAPEKIRQLAIMNGVKRNVVSEVEVELRQGQHQDGRRPRTLLQARIPQSERLVASPAKATVSDLTANLAYHARFGSNVIRDDLRAVASELIEELSI